MAKQGKKTPSYDYDIVIIGGGMVGASLAIALLPLTKEPHQLKICIIDAFQHNADSQPSYDDRSIALSHGSSLIFKGMGLWNELQSKTSPIKQIHISDRGHFGATRLTAAQEKVPSLGYLVESRVLGQQLYKVLANSEIEQIIPASVIEVSTENDKLASLTIIQGEKTQRISTRLLVGADGTNSKVRELLGITTSISDYQQSAIIANVTTQKPHQGQAFERFTEHGPIALLPMTANRSSLVWTHNTEAGSAEIDAILSLDDKTFLKQLDEAFGYRLGKFTKVGKRSSYPLSLVTSDKNSAFRTVIIGNASHTLHPVAGQGLNLALRDVAVLSDLVTDLYAKDKSPHSIAELLVSYEESRAADLNNTIRYTDSLVRLFSNDNRVLGHARAGGLMAVDRISPVRKWISKQSMGINHRQSRLARGLGLRISS